MLEKFGNWFNEYYTEITWFIIGVLFNNATIHLSIGHYDTAAIDVILAGINYLFWKNRNV